MANLSNDYPLRFICEIVQRGRIKPAKYKHWLKMPRDLYEELVQANIIKPENYFIEQSVFFEYSYNTVIMNFVNQYMIDDIHLKIYHYLLCKLAYDPLERGGTMF